MENSTCAILFVGLCPLLLPVIQYQVTFEWHSMRSSELTIELLPGYLQYFIYLFKLSFSITQNIRIASYCSYARSASVFRSASVRFAN